MSGVVTGFFLLYSPGTHSFMGDMFSRRAEQQPIGRDVEHKWKPIGQSHRRAEVGSGAVECAMFVEGQHMLREGRSVCGDTTPSLGSTNTRAHTVWISLTALMDGWVIS